MLITDLDMCTPRNIRSAADALARAAKVDSEILAVGVRVVAAGTRRFRVVESRVLQR